MQSVSGTIVTVYKSGLISLRDPASTFAIRMNQIYFIGKYNPEYTLTMRNASGSIIQNITLAAHLEYRIIFYKTRLTSEQLPLIASISTGVSSRTVQSHSAPISGTYTISQNGTLFQVGSSTNIAASSTAPIIQNALNIFYNSTEISVVQVAPSQLVDQIVFSINYIGIQDPLDFTIDVG
jgi:hypothetical protein